MLSFNNLALRRGTDRLFENVTFTILEGKKVGLVGANGSGKTSLFKLIVGELEPDDGSMDLSSSLTIAHLSQEVPASDESALEYVQAGDTRLKEILDAIGKAEQSENYEALGALHDRLEAVDGYTARSRAEKLLIGLGFSESEFEQPIRSFSGGWRVRLNLAHTLMQPSDLLLLDEPTNHLDLDAILWLSDWIKHYQGALILISHDREFLDECVAQIADLSHQRIELFNGNYTQFERVKAARLAEQNASYVKQQREVKHMQEFVRRFRYKATKARQAQSRLKALERMELIAPAHVDSPFEFTIRQSDKISDPLLVLDEADLGYEQVILNGIRLSLQPGDRIGLLGPNGAGKSTLIKSLHAEIPLLAGDRVEGSNLKTGYFSQHQVDDLNLSQSALDHIQDLDKSISAQEIKNFLGGFNFQGSKTEEPVVNFSGGEKARLALSIVTFSAPNLLLLDEPTNHLDIDMRQALTVALQDFNGAILLISHDQHLLASTVDRFLLVDNGSISEFNGDLNDYRARVLSSSKAIASEPASAPASTQEARIESVKPVAKADYKKIRQLRTKISTAEKRLERLQRKLGEVEQALSDPDIYDAEDGPGLHTLIRDQTELKVQIEQIETEWLQLTEALEASE